MDEYNEPEPERDEMALVDNLTDEQIEKWDGFIDLVNEAVEHVFGEEPVQLLLGLQFGGMGEDPNLPTCIGTSNMGVCQTRAAVDDLVSFFDAQHNEAHRQLDANSVTVPMDLSAVPEELRAKVEALVQQMGGTLDNVQFIEVADTSDLNALPETEED